MRLGRRKVEQKSMWLSYDQLPQSQGHVLYEWLQQRMVVGNAAGSLRLPHCGLLSERLGGSVAI